MFFKNTLSDTITSSLWLTVFLLSSTSLLVAAARAAHERMLALRRPRLVVALVIAAVRRRSASMRLVALPSQSISQSVYYSPTLKNDSVRMLQCRLDTEEKSPLTGAR